MHFDGIVIGAGAAGLAAARDWSAAGKRICLIEARDRIGGRVQTIRPAGLPLPIELGAEFIHGSSASTFSIVDAAALTVYEVPDTHWWALGEQWSYTPDFWGQMARIRRGIGRLHRDVSFATFLSRQRSIPPKLRELAIGYVEGYHAAHADRISALAVGASDEEQSASMRRQYRIASGYDRTMEWMLAGIAPDRCDIRLETIATSIRWRRGEVVVRTRHHGIEDSVRARAGIITLPVGVLKAAAGEAGSVRFEPEIEEKRAALSQIEIGHVVKTILRFRERFWEDEAFLTQRGMPPQKPVNFVHASSRYLQTWWTMTPLRSPIVVAWAGGHAADALLAEPAESRVGRVLEETAKAFGIPAKRLVRLLCGSWVHDWQADPFSRGAYSYAAVGGSRAHATLARPVAGTLFFAGEATNGEETGTVAGAIDRGRAAVRLAMRE